MNVRKPVDETTSSTRLFHVAFCVDELRLLRDAMETGISADGAYILQGDIARSLQARGHVLTFVGRRDALDIEYTTDLRFVARASRSWTESRWFETASKAMWRVQRWLGVPYLNVFSNWRLLDACVQHLPGHDLVYERNGLYSFGVARACRRLALPYVAFFDADQILEQDFIGRPIRGLLRWWASRLLRYNLNAANRIICVSQASRNHLVKNWGISADKITVFQNGVDIDRFRPDIEARAKIRADLGIASSPVVGFVGSFFGWHDIQTLLRAFALVVPQFPDARLVLVGDGQTRPLMAEQARSIGLGHAVRFLGSVAHGEVNRLLNAIDVAVAPYPTAERELWFSPMKVFEYMAAGRALVASESGQLPQIIEHGRNGLLVEPGSTQALANALGQLLADADLRDRLGREARYDAIMKHSWERYGARLERLFDAVAAGRAPEPD